LQNEGIADLSSGISKSKSIKKLDVRNNYISSSGAESLANSLVLSQSVEILYLANNYFCDFGAKYIAKGLIDSHVLIKELEFGKIYCDALFNGRIQQCWGRRYGCNL
jgi:Ran GTPase-activating protein (RanGAP) involved in mRNA processing and transport